MTNTTNITPFGTCPGCGYATKVWEATKVRAIYERCDNPACMENPTISEERKTIMRAEHAKREAEAAERERMRRARAMAFNYRSNNG